MSDSVSLQPARNIMEIKKTLDSPRQKKRCRVNYNQNKYSNMIIFGTKYELFLLHYQITFFLAFGQAKIFLSYHILMNILIREQENSPLDNCPQDNDPPTNSPRDNSPPDNYLQCQLPPRQSPPGQLPPMPIAPRTITPQTITPRTIALCAN